MHTNDILFYATILWIVITSAVSLKTGKADYSYREVCKVWMRDLSRYLMLMALLGVVCWARAAWPRWGALLGYAAFMTALLALVLPALALSKKIAAASGKTEAGEDPIQILPPNHASREYARFFHRCLSPYPLGVRATSIPGKCGLCGIPTAPPGEVAERFSNGFTEICRNCYDKATE